MSNALLFVIGVVLISGGLIGLLILGSASQYSVLTENGPMYSAVLRLFNYLPLLGIFLMMGSAVTWGLQRLRNIAK